MEILLAIVSNNVVQQGKYAYETGLNKIEARNLVMLGWLVG